AVVSEPYTRLTCDSVAKYHTSTWRVISHSTVAVTPPMSAWRSDSRPTSITRYTEVSTNTSPATPSRYSSAPDTPCSDHSWPRSSTLSWPMACRLPATSVTIRSPTPRLRM